jgi:hypothetical protein
MPRQGPWGEEPLAFNRLGEEDRLGGRGKKVAMTTATEVGYVEMRIAKIVGLSTAEDEPFHQYVVLEDVAGDRHLAN